MFKLSGVIVLCLLSVYWIETSLEPRLKQSSIERQEVKVVNIYPSKEERMFSLFKEQCKEKIGKEFVDKYMNCTQSKMREYLNVKKEEGKNSFSL